MWTFVSGIGAFAVSAQAKLLVDRFTEQIDSSTIAEEKPKYLVGSRRTSFNEAVSTCASLGY